MERSIALCNGISQWVQLMVLSRPTPQLRAEVFIKFIQVAQVSDGIRVRPGLQGKVSPLPTAKSLPPEPLGVSRLELTWHLVNVIMK